MSPGAGDVGVAVGAAVVAVAVAVAAGTVGVAVGACGVRAGVAMDWLPLSPLWIPAGTAETRRWDLPIVRASDVCRRELCHRERDNSKQHHKEQVAPPYRANPTLWL
ncbi:MAG: hypothetical protein R2873_33250 [Caldilineaceae bacterium]